ncbi:hypothetical protein F2Q69_00047008 [Brassica cretica]|uniref:Protein kinase domain-containing protein n=1 Tax=Brassica cretica TaxID=69181 RepID=A0A8S9PX22_BRACR|nr:hypothetical protein F2Q69_00047008 [Brassica cretica]
MDSDEDFFAVKEVSIAEQGSQAQGCIQQLEKDISLLSPLQHQNIVRYLGTAKDGSILYIFLELVTQDLSVSNSSRWSALMTRSLEFPDRISFRNFRAEYGEMDPYDFAISVDAWEAFKLKIHKYPVQDLNEGRLLESADTNEGGTVSHISSPVYSSGSVITSWLKGDLLGRGSFGPVDGDFFAVKEVSIAEQESQAQGCIQKLEKDISLLSPLQHQNIVRYLGTAKDWSILYIFLELVTQGSLLQLYQRYPLRNSVASTYTRQILDGLKYLHGEGFIHQDIRCANILVDASGSVKLADFGLAKVSKLNDIMSYNRTPFWMAPELPDIPDTLSLDARDFITKCLKVNPEEQPTAAELLNHPFASSGSS